MCFSSRSGCLIRDLLSDTGQIARKTITLSRIDREHQMDINHFSEASTSLKTVRDCLRFSVSRFNEAELFFGHGSENAYDEAAYLILHTLNLPLDRLEPFLDARLTQSEIYDVLDVIERRTCLLYTSPSPRDG